MSNVTEINLETGEVFYREYSERDLEVNAKISEELEAETQRVSKRQELLYRLGITEEEAKLLLGGGN